jgi:hypothetical protein
MTLFLYRALGAMVLDGGSYEELESNRRTTAQAAIVILLSSLAIAIGAGGPSGLRWTTLVGSTMIAIVVWMSWAMLTFQIGTRVLPTGFSAAPGLLQVSAIIPEMATPVRWISVLWMFAAMVVAVQHALDYRSTLRAAGVCGLSAVVVIVVAILASLGTEVAMF